MRLLIESKALVDHRNDSNGDRPLHVACRQGSVQCVQALLDGHAETRVANLYGVTPATLARISHKEQWAQLLLLSEQPQARSATSVAGKFVPFLGIM